MKKIRFTQIDTSKLFRFPDNGKLPFQSKIKLKQERQEIASRKCCSRRIIFACGAGLKQIKRLQEVKIKFVLNRQ